MPNLVRLAMVAILSMAVFGLPAERLEKVDLELEEFLYSAPLASSPLLNHQRRQTTTTPSPAKPDATVQLCTEPHFGGQCYNATLPQSACINLHGFSHNVQTFVPAQSPSVSCLLTQGRCDVTLPYASFDSSDFKQQQPPPSFNSSATSGQASTIAAWAEDLQSHYTWAEEANSYICFAEAAALKRFVRVQRMRILSAKAEVASPL